MPPISAYEIALPSKFNSAKNTTELWKCVIELGMSSSSAKADFSLRADVNTLNAQFSGYPAPVALRDSRPTARISPDNQFYFKYVEALDVIKAILCQFECTRP